MQATSSLTYIGKSAPISLHRNLFSVPLDSLLIHSRLLRSCHVGVLTSCAILCLGYLLRRRPFSLRLISEACSYMHNSAERSIPPFTHTACSCFLPLVFPHIIPVLYWPEHSPSPCCAVDFLALECWQPGTSRILLQLFEILSRIKQQRTTAVKWWRYAPTSSLQCLILKQDWVKRLSLDPSSKQFRSSPPSRLGSRIKQRKSPKIHSLFLFLVV